MVFQQLLTSAVLLDCKNSLQDAFQCIAQPNTALHDCILYLYDPGISPGSANQCIPGNVYLYQGNVAGDHRIDLDTLNHDNSSITCVIYEGCHSSL